VVPDDEQAAEVVLMSGGEDGEARAEATSMSEIARFDLKSETV
jgi:hypothetical protein